MSAPHSSWLLDDEWWACRFPERPASEGTVYEERCPACAIAAAADLALNGDRTMFDMDDDDDECMLSDIAAGLFLPVAAQ